MKHRRLLPFIFLFLLKPLLSQPPELANYPSIPQKVSKLIEYAVQCNEKEQYSQAKNASLHALSLSRQSNIDTLISQSLYYAGISYKNLALYDSAIYYLNQLSNATHKFPPELTVKRDLNLAQSYENIGKMDSVSSIMKRLEKNTYLKTDSLNSINVKYLMFRGILNEDKGNYEPALEDYMKALHVAQKINDSVLITDNLTNIGAFYFNIEKYDKSLEYFEQAVTYFNQRGKADGLQACTSYRTMGIAYARTGRKELGIKFANKAIAIADKLKITKLSVFCYSGLATIFLEIKDYQSAEFYYLQCADLLKNSDLKFNKLSIYGQLGRVNFEQKKFNAAKQYFEKANSIALQVGRKASIASSFKDLARTEAALGNFSKAYEYHQTYSAYQDSINTETSNKNIAEMDAKYQTERKQQQIELLNAQNKTQLLEIQNQRLAEYFLLAVIGLILVIAGLLWRSFRTKQRVNKELNEKNEELNTLIERVSESNEELTVLNEKLNEANQSKTKLFSIISHDLRSPVASLFQYLKMQEKEFLHLDDSAKQKYNASIIQSAENLAEVMEDLLIWAKSQMEYFELSMEPVNLKELLSEVIKIHDIQTTQKGIFIQLDCRDNLQFVTDTNFLKIIIRNLVSNAIKFSPENDAVKISAADEGNDLIISVKDNGIGLSNEQLTNIFSWDAVRIGSSGIGLKLTREFTEKLNGSLVINTSPGKGSEFLVRFKSISGKS